MCSDTLEKARLQLQCNNFDLKQLYITVKTKALE